MEKLVVLSGESEWCWKSVTNKFTLYQALTDKNRKTEAEAFQEQDSE